MRRFGVLAGVVALAAASLVVALGSAAGAGPQSQTFDYTGVSETFTVPTDVCDVTIAAARREPRSTPGPGPATAR